MAEVVLGIGTSHGPMLVTDIEHWGKRLGADRANQHAFRGGVWSFDDLVAARRDEGLAALITEDAWYERQRRCQAAIENLADVFAAAKPDVAVIIGNDQMEIFDDRLIPAFSVFYGDEITNYDLPPARVAKMPPGIDVSVRGYIPEGGATYRGRPELALQIIEQAMADQFDVASMKALPKPETPHAFGFVYRRIMRDNPIPSVPVLINTFYRPNQPSARRCAAFGQSILRAIEAWESDLRVALIASGGLTHFVIDETLDQMILDAMRRGDIEPIVQLGEEIFQDGTSEVKNWIPLAAAMSALRYEPTVVDYVPCYRSEAGTGNAMGFVHWRP